MFALVGVDVAVTDGLDLAERMVIRLAKIVSLCVCLFRRSGGLEPPSRLCPPTAHLRIGNKNHDSRHNHHSSFV